MLRSRVVWNGVAGSPYYSNFYWGGSGATSAGQAQDATIAWAAGIALGVVPPLALTVESEVVELNEETGGIVAAFNVAGSTSNGARTGNPLPFRNQIVVNLGTTSFRRGRRVKGRSFVGGLSEDDSTTGFGPAEPFRESIQNVYDLNLLQAPALYGVWSRPIPAGPGEPGAIGEFSPVTSVQARTTWSSLRSRGA